MINETNNWKTRVRRELADLAVGATALTVLFGSCIGPLTFVNYRNEKAREGQNLALWEEFSGQIPEYNVEISESVHKNGESSRLVTLKAIDSATKPAEITGHDYNVDGTIDRIFIMQNELDACDSVYLTPERVIWAPSQSSKDTKKPQFTPTQIRDAETKLYDALRTVRTEDNKYRHWTPEMKDTKDFGLIKKVSE